MRSIARSARPLLASLSTIGAFAGPIPISLAADPTALLLETPGGRKTVTLADLRRQLKPVRVTLDDPVYKTKKSFDAFRLFDVIGLAGPVPDGPSDIDEVVFQARDGYAPSVPLAKARAHQAVIAFQESGTKLGFGKVQQGKAWVSPAPYYLVWEEGKALPEEFPWPYQLVRIELVSFAKKFPKLYPREAKPDSAEMRGFHVFKAQCMRCHSMNLEGGDLGPELNVPKNITEYWDRDTLREFVRNPESFRLKSKMPAFEKTLKGEELDDLFEYIAYMKGHKR